MTTSIERRLEALEQKLSEPERMTIWIHSVSTGRLNRAVTRIRHNDQDWRRLDGETEAAFRTRAEAEAVLQPGHTGLLMLMD